MILKLADELSFKNVLDVGCGNGELLAVLIRRSPRVRAVGADISARAIAMDPANLPAFEFHQLDIGLICPTDSIS